MASTQIGIVKIADGTIKQVINPSSDGELNAYPLQAGETMTKVNRTSYQTYGNMKTLATALGLKN